jgi:hypothetical protein
VSSGVPPPSPQDLRWFFREIGMAVLGWTAVTALGIVFDFWVGLPTIVIAGVILIALYAVMLWRGLRVPTDEEIAVPALPSDPRTSGALPDEVAAEPSPARLKRRRAWGAVLMYGGAALAVYAIVMGVIIAGETGPIVVALFGLGAIPLGRRLRRRGEI